MKGYGRQCHDSNKKCLLSEPVFLIIKVSVTVAETEYVLHFTEIGHVLIILSDFPNASFIDVYSGTWLA